MKNSYSYISVFSGAGGLDIGLEKCGLNTVSLCEIEKVFCDTLHENKGFIHCDGINYFEGAKIVNSDIRDVSSDNLTLENDIDLVVGGPPCQAFSSSGKQLSILDPRGALVSEYQRIVDEVKPKMFLFENVRGLVTARDASGEPGGVITELINIFEKLGYSCRTQLLNSADYGSYQRRIRCFILGTKCGKAPLFPEPTHQKDSGLFSKPWHNLHDFLTIYADDNEDSYTYPSEQLADQLTDIPNGSGLKSQGKTEQTRPGGHWGYRQGTFIANLTLPARTVTGSASQDWVRWNGKLRRLTLNEVKLLQGFPKDWSILGTKAQQYKQIGNAVPSIFGELIGKVIVDFLDNYPNKIPEFIDIPSSFKGYIEYTKKDHERNKESRSVHTNFI